MVRNTIVTVALMGMVLSLVACGPSAEKARREAPAVDVQTVVAAAVEEPAVVEAVGSVRSAREAVLSSKVMGVVTAIPKNAGESVKSGEVLVVVDSRDVAGQIQQAQGGLAQAKAATAISETNYKRFQQLFEKGAASQLELDQARYQYDTAKGAVAQAEGAVATASSYQSYAEIPAPFDGRIVDRLCEVGDMAAPGRPLVKVEDSRRLRLDVSVSEQHLRALSVGAPVKVVIPALDDRSFDGTVSELVPAADPATHSFLVKITLPQDAALRTGLYGRAQFGAGTRKAVRVPRSAVVTRGGMTGVWIVDAGKAHFRLVTASELTADSPEILAGLSGGESVIVSPPAQIEEDSEVRS